MKLSHPRRRRPATSPPKHPTATPNFPLALAVLLAAVVLAAGILTSCSQQPANSRSAEAAEAAEVDSEANPQIGYTGFDSLPAATVASQLPSQLTSPADQDQSRNLPAAQQPTEPASSDQVSQTLHDELSGLSARPAVELLVESGYSSEQLCGEAPFVDDFALPEIYTQAVVTPQNARATAADVAARAAEYYQVIAEVYRSPNFEQLLCLSRVATEPKLKWLWSDLKHLASQRSGVEFLQPTDVQVVGLLTGSALAVACLPSGMYGPLARDDQPIAAFMLLRWAGQRWRVASTQDMPELGCQELANLTILNYQSDVAADGSEWMLSFDQFETIISNRRQ